MATYISGIEYELGDLVAIEELKQRFPDASDKVDYLIAGGFENYSRIDADVAETAVRCARRSLDSSGAAPDTVHAIIIATVSSSGSEPLSESGDVQQLMTTLGVTRALPVRLGSVGCINFATQLTVAMGLLGSEDDSSVLVISIGVAQNDDESRIFSSGSAVKSDAVVSYCVSTTPLGLEMTAVRHGYNAGISRHDPYPAVRGCLQRVTTEALAASGLTRSDIGLVLTDHSITPLSQGLVELAGFDLDSAFTANQNRFSRALAGDELIDLKTVMETDRLAIPDNTLVLTVAGCGASAVILSQSK